MLAALSAVLFLGGGAVDAKLRPDVTLVVVEAMDPGVARAVDDGLAVALRAWMRAGEQPLRLHRVPRGSLWGGQAPALAAAIARIQRPVLIAPPERRLAHVVAQIGTRAHVPVLALDGGPALERSGSWWVTTVPGTRSIPAPLEAAFRRRTARSTNAGARAAVHAVALVHHTRDQGAASDRMHLARALRRCRDDGTRMVTVRSGVALRRVPHASAPPCSVVPYGTHVHVQATRRGWVRVASPAGTVGWFRARRSGLGGRSRCARRGSLTGPSGPAVLRRPADGMPMRADARRSRAGRTKHRRAR